MTRHPDERTSPRLPWAVALLTLSLSGALLAGYQARLYVVFDRGALALALAGLLAAMVIVLFPPQHGLVFSRLGLVGAGLLGWSLVSTLASGRPWAAFVGEPTSMLGFAALAASAAIALAATSVSNELRRALVAVSPWVLGGESLLILYQLARGLAPAGTLANSTYAGVLALALMPWVMADLDQRSRPSQALRSGVTVLAFVALAAGGSRVVLALALIWATWFVIKRAPLSTALRAVILGGLGVSVLAAGLTFSRAEILGSLSSATLGERPQMYRLALRAALQRPLLGWGPDGFFAGGAGSSTPDLVRTGSLYIPSPGGYDPHNLLLFAAVSLGLVGMVLVIALAGFTVTTWRARSGEGLDVAPAAWATALPVLAFLSAPAIVLVVPLVALNYGLSVAPRVGAPSSAPVSSRARWSIGVALALVCGLLAANVATGHGPRVSECRDLTRAGEVVPDRHPVLGLGRTPRVPQFTPSRIRGSDHAGDLAIAARPGRDPACCPAGPHQRILSAGAG